MAALVATPPRRSVSQQRISERPRVLAKWLHDQREPVVMPVTLVRVPGGHTNVTWMVEDRATHCWALRERAGADRRGFSREVTVLRALAKLGQPVARVVGSGDARWAAPFIVTAWVEGSTLRSESNAQQMTAARCRRIGAELIDTLAGLHSIAPDSLGLSTFGIGHLDRQLARMSDVWTRAGSSGEYDSAWRAVRARLIECRPAAEPPATLVHGDFRLDNLLFEGGRLRAVLDWERCTVGNPLTDLAWLLNSWCSTDEQASDVSGVPDPDELAARYRQCSETPLDDLGYHRALAHWIAATLLQDAETRSRTAGLVNVRPDVTVDAAIRRELMEATSFLGRRG